MAINPYEDAAAAFLQRFPLEATVYGEEIITFAEDHADGLAADMAIPDDKKKLTAVRRHLNLGGASRSFAETERFFIDVEDARRGSYRVRKLADHVYNKATEAFSKSVNAGMAPLTQSQKAIDDIKKDELDEEERNDLETNYEELVNALTPLRQVFHKSAVDRWVHRLESRGYSPEQARNLIELLPAFQREIKILKKTS